MLDVPRTLEYLGYLGYHYHHDTQLTALHGKYTFYMNNLWDSRKYELNFGNLDTIFIHRAYKYEGRENGVYILF